MTCILALDGLASAMILRHAFSMLGTKPRIEFLVHGTPEHRSAGLARGVMERRRSMT